MELMRAVAFSFLFGGLLFGQAPPGCTPIEGGPIGGACQSTIKARCFNECVINCRDDGECIFGCMVGQDFNADRCYPNCNGFSPLCLQSCLQTIDCISRGCSVNNRIKINAGTIALNRTTGRWQQTLKLTNISCDRLESLVFNLQSVASGWRLTNGDNQAGNAPFKNFGALDSTATTTLVLQFERTGTTPLSYSPVIGGSVVPAGTVASPAGTLKGAQIQ